MSALPPKATGKADMPQMVMSALPPKADMCSALAHVRFRPIADIGDTYDRLGSKAGAWQDHLDAFYSSPARIRRSRSAALFNTFIAAWYPGLS
jgi:hypothetical protein